VPLPFDWVDVRAMHLELYEHALANR
jgi:hypothetical protein